MHVCVWDRIHTPHNEEATAWITKHRSSTLRMTQCTQGMYVYTYIHTYVHPHGSKYVCICIVMLVTVTQWELHTQVHCWDRITLFNEGPIQSSSTVNSINVTSIHLRKNTNPIQREKRRGSSTTCVQPGTKHKILH